MQYLPGAKEKPSPVHEFDAPVGVLNVVFSPDADPEKIEAYMHQLREKVARVDGVVTAHFGIGSATFERPSDHLLS